MDKKAIDKRHLDDQALEKLSEAFDAGWLHNVLSRITPLTLRRKDDYIAMADIFIETEEEALRVLNRFDADIEMFCSVADIMVTKHMTSENVSEELRSHVDLYNDVARLFTAKFDLELQDPIKKLIDSPIMTEASNPFIKDFIDERFNR